MHSWNIEWLTLRDLVGLAAAIAVSQGLYYLVVAALRRIQSRRDSLTAGSILRHLSAPLRLLLVLIAFSSTLAEVAPPADVDEPVTHGLQIAYILTFAWLAVASVQIVSDSVESRLPRDILDDVQARRRQTQVYLLRRIIVGLVLVSALAASLMTFPSIRSIGAGLFASAGLAGLALGMAARPTLGNLLAGIQIALAEPIRINDAVVVEGELGRVAEINATYLVVRLWDLRNLVVPLSYFIEKPFQNWTRHSSELVGSVFLPVDYTVPLAALREEYRRILGDAPLWDGKVSAVQVTDTKDRSVEVRFLMSAANPSATFDLGCHVREQLVEYMQREHAEALPCYRHKVVME